MILIRNRVILIRNGSWLDKAIRKLPLWIGHYQSVRVGLNTRTWLQFSWIKPKCPTCHGNGYNGRWECTYD